MRDKSADSAELDLAPIVTGLRSAREQGCITPQCPLAGSRQGLPSTSVLAQVVESLRSAIFPMNLAVSERCHEHEDDHIGRMLDCALSALLQQVRLELSDGAHYAGNDTDLESRAQGIVRDFAASLPSTRRLLNEDVLAAYRGDPAARSIDEVLLCYPGVRAIVNYRLAHQLYRLGAPLLARIVAELAHSETGIDIHPGASIDAGVFIDHGTGVVIGETTVIGRNVRMYQHVTLGAKRFESGDDGMLVKGIARHPIVEDDVVIYAGATILGRVTIGRNSAIGGNVWLTYSVPPGSNITHTQASEAVIEPRSAEAVGRSSGLCLNTDRRLDTFEDRHVSR